jgi:hypothetical protein
MVNSEKPTTGGSVAAAIFWMKARAGWREKHDLTVNTQPLKDYTDAELVQMIATLSTTIAATEAGQGGPDVIGRVTHPDRRQVKISGDTVHHRASTVDRW